VVLLLLGCLIVVLYTTCIVVSSINLIFDLVDVFGSYQLLLLIATSCESRLLGLFVINCVLLLLILIQLHPQLLRLLAPTVLLLMKVIPSTSSWVSKPIHVINLV
jgi:hypothetical protein